MRRHFPLTFPSKRTAELYLASVQREQPDARLVNLRRRTGGWAACLSTGGARRRLPRLCSVVSGLLRSVLQGYWGYASSISSEIYVVM